MHIIREFDQLTCPVCKAKPFEPCVMATPIEEKTLQLKEDLLRAGELGVLNNDMKPPQPTPREYSAQFDQDGHSEAYFLEFSILRDIRRLKKLKPDHELVRVIFAYYKYQESRESESLVEKQQREYRNAMFPQDENEGPPEG